MSEQAKTTLKIKRETTIKRCEICHQSDFFDFATNVCQRCQTAQNDKEEKNLERNFSNTFQPIGSKLDEVTLWWFKIFKFIHKPLLIGLSFGVIFQIIDSLTMDKILPFEWFYFKGKAYYIIPKAIYHMIATSFIGMAMLLSYYTNPILEDSCLRKIAKIICFLLVPSLIVF